MNLSSGNFLRRSGCERSQGHELCKWMARVEENESGSVVEEVQAGEDQEYARSLAGQRRESQR